MGQIWTKNKPTTAGWYWAMMDNIAKILRVEECDYLGNDKFELCIFMTGAEDPFPLRRVPDNVLWGSSRIPEPLSAKY